MAFHVPEKLRVATAHIPLKIQDANNGMFIVPSGYKRPYALRCVASNGDDWVEAGLPAPPWEHVSVSTAVRCPTWEEMCRVKDLFWDPEDAVFQIHPPEKEYINQHPYCLHLWRPVGIVLPRPPSITVGV